MPADERPGSRSRMIERVRERREAHKGRSRTYRVLFAVLAFSVLLGGIVLSLPLVPGPGFVLVAAGLAMLALEFAWAERLLEKVLHRLERVGSRAARATRLQKTAVAAAAVAVVAAAVTAAVYWDIGPL